MGNKRHRLGVGGKRRRGLEMWRVGVKRRGSRRRGGEKEGYEMEGKEGEL